MEKEGDIILRGEENKGLLTTTVGPTASNLSRVRIFLGTHPLLAIINSMINNFCSIIQARRALMPEPMREIPHVVIAPAKPAPQLVFAVSDLNLMDAYLSWSSGSSSLWMVIA